MTYTQIVTMLNLRQKGPGSQEARRDQMNVKPNKTDIDAGRFTLTVTAVDLPNNTVSVIEGPGGPVRTYKANTIAKQDMLKKIKVGDVVIGLTTPLMVTAISPAQLALSGHERQRQDPAAPCTSCPDARAASGRALRRSPHRSVSRAAREPASIAHCSCGSGANSAMKVAL